MKESKTFNQYMEERRMKPHKREATPYDLQEFYENNGDIFIFNDGKCSYVGKEAVDIR